jgi:hypothetical protein
MRKTSRLIPLLITPLLLTSCISYSVGTTARPIPKDEFQRSVVVYFVPNGIEPGGDGSDSLAYASTDWEGRWGLSDRADVGLRVPPGGVIINYKRLLNGPNNPDRLAVSSLLGTGIVNFGNHAFVEAGLIASGSEDGSVPYGGVRAMHVLPISTGAVTDTPTAGVFGGMRLRIGTNFSLSPELGIYYDESALELRKRNIIFIPGITFHWH